MKKITVSKKWLMAYPFAILMAIGAIVLNERFISRPESVTAIQSTLKLTIEVGDGFWNGDLYYRQVQILKSKVFCFGTDDRMIVHGSLKEQQQLLYFIQKSSRAEARRPIGSLERIIENESLRKQFADLTTGSMELQSTSDFNVGSTSCHRLPYNSPVQPSSNPVLTTRETDRRKQLG
jgi:hypothetical protein